MIARRSLVPTGLATAMAFAGFMLPGGSLAQDVRHMCSEKYQAAKAAGTLGGETWPQFYSRCTAELKANPPAGAASQPAAEAAPPPLDVRHICSQKYQAAKAAGSLGGESWPQFYSRCTAEVKANPAAAAPAAAAAPPPPVAETPPPTPAAPPPPAPVAEEPAPPPPPAVAETPPPPPPPVAETPPPTPAAPPPPATAPTPINPLKKPAAKAPAPAAAAPATPGTAVFPTAIAPEFASEKPAKARMKTCQKQYNANKAANANGGLKWIQKGGGYWSECNKRLKS
jgi:hypothetical protein